MNRVALDLGFVQIYWYSICILVGMMVGMFVVYRETIRKKISDNLITNLIFYTIIIAIIGARLYYVIFDWGYYSKNMLEIFEIWNGGLAIHGAIILGGLFLIYFTRIHKLDTLKVLDICSVGLIIGQAIGRWGNFFNQEVYGGVVSREFLKGLFLPDFIVDGMKVLGEYHQPLFLYESIWCVIGFIILLLVRRRKYIKTGQIFGIYCMWYSVGRFFLEGMRDSKYNLMIGSLKTAQVVSIGMFLIGLFFFVRRIKTSRFEHLYNDSSVQVESNANDEKNKPFFETRKSFNSSKEVKPTIQEQSTQLPQEPTIVQNNPQQNLSLQSSGPVLNNQLNDLGGTVDVNQVVSGQNLQGANFQTMNNQETFVDINQNNQSNNIIDNNPNIPMTNNQDANLSNPFLNNNQNVSSQNKFIDNNQNNTFSQ